MKNILICDDEKDIVEALKIYLNRPDYRLLSAYGGAEAIEIARRERLDLILMDIMMPGVDGLTALARIRAESDVPIILLTAKSEDSDKILGLNIGADDYVTKPFNPLEVAARVNSQLRRYSRFGAEEAPEVFRAGGIELDDRSKSVTADGEPVSLTPKEYEILRLLISNPGKVFSPKEIYNAVWKETPFPGNDNTVAVHVRHIREKIEIDPTEPRYLRVIFGQGYLLEGDKKK
ncbi:MAG: response regulator transcription factor [Lachnospiraceae bacterium]|nr:response regulator transcription factor [Lachnospiraceae bacterium]